MLFSSRVNPSDPYSLTSLSSLTKKSILFQSPTIHSARVRTIVFPDGTTYGKLHKTSVKREKSAQGPTNIDLEKAERAFAAQNWRRELTENIKEEELEKGLRNYLGISQSLRPKTAAFKENTGHLSDRGITSSQIKRAILAKSSSKKMLTQSSMEKTLRKDLMCSTEGFNTRDFTDDKKDEKFQHITFMKAPSKATTKLSQAVSSIFNNAQVRLSTHDVTMVPSDSRRVVVEAIMRDFFLNLIPENSDYLICKNSQNHIYTIVFTGRLVPTCKACSTSTRFELSKDLGFQILCNSPYCNVKTLYAIKLNGKASECLWPIIKTSDIEVSLPLKASEKRPVISKIIQSGRYKITDFSRVMTDSAYSTTSPRGATERPMTTANVMRISTSREKFNNLALKTCQTERSHRDDDDHDRPNTVQALRRLTNLRPGTSGLRPGTSGSSETREFKGALVLRVFDDKGLFSRQKTDRDVIEQVSEEVSKNEEEKEDRLQKNLKQKEKKTIRGKVFLSERPLVKKTKKNNDIGKLSDISIPLEKRNIFGSPEMDNSLEDIHKMVDILNKGK